MKTEITIRTKKGKEIIRRAEIVDYISSNGNQYSIAYVGRTAYRIITHDARGSVWAVNN